MKELKIIDVDSVEIVQVPHICNGINFWLLQLEQIFIERKLNEGGISLQEESKVTTVINPKSNFIIEEGQRAIIIP